MKRIFSSLLIGMTFLMLITSCGSKTEESNKEEVSTTVVATEKAGITSGTYMVDVAQSSVAWKGKKVAYGHNGTVLLKSGSLVVTDGVITGGEFVIDMNSIVSLDIEEEEKNAKLITHLASQDFFSVAEYPEASFKITEVNGAVVTGDLTIKDKTNPVSFEPTLSDKDGVLVAKSSIVFDRSKFDVKFNSSEFPKYANLAADKLINNDVEIEVVLKAKK